MEQPKLDIGKNLRKFRDAKKLTQGEVAKATGMKQPNYFEIETGNVIPTIPTLQKLADFFEVSLSKLFENEEVPATTNMQNNSTITGNLNGVNNSTINFFEQKEVLATLQSAINEAVVEALAKLSK